MQVKDTLFPVIVIPAGIAFLGICLLVYLSRGKNGRLIAAKLKVGAFLLSFSWFALSYGCNTSTCYEPLMVKDSINLYKGSDSLSTGDTLKLSIHNPSFNNFSYFFLDSTTTELKQSGKIVATDSSFNKSYIIPDSALPAGIYFLDIYGEANEELNKTKFIERFIIHIKK